ncbi:N-acetylmuramoyl-L-alanine amidase [Micromonosporaceae bacterium Da 78-11]
MNRRLAIGIGTAAAVLAAGGGAAVLTRPSSPTPVAAAADETITSIPPDPDAEPTAVRATADEVAITPAGAGATTFTVPQRDTKQFNLLSVSWTDPAAAPKGTVQVRTRSVKTRKWSDWQDLAIAEGAADQGTERAEVRGRTDPLWADRSDGVAARLVASGASPAPLPAGLRINLIDPDASPGGQGGGGQGGGEPLPSASATTPGAGQSEEPVEGGEPAGSGEPVDEATTEPTNPPVSEPPTAPTTEPVPTGTPEAPATTAPAKAPASARTAAAASGTTSVLPVPSSTAPVLTQLPPYVSRAGWGANEALVTDELLVAPQAKMVWVHHTGFGNGYTCAQSASVLRGIQANDVREGMSDMGYNFLVDQCGTLFEGRKGSVGKAVIGAHIQGFNTGSVGIALLGNYEDAEPSAAAQTTIAQVAAARLGAYGFNPTTSAVMTEGASGKKWPEGAQVTFPRIAGHRDGDATVCPGAHLYPLLPAIRARSVQMITGFAARSLGGGTSTGGVFHVRTGVTITWAMTTPSSAIDRFELLLDGRVTATLPGTARSGTYQVAPGNHTVAVRAVHVGGATAITPGYRVVADLTAPSFAVAPTPVLRPGTYSTTYAPVTVGYRAADNAKVYTVAATSPARVNLPPTGTAWYTAMRPARATTFVLTARDPSGNSRTASVTRQVKLLAETSAKRGGTWTKKSAGSYLNGKALTASRKNAKLTYTFTGRSAALLFSRGTRTGKLYVYLDGKKVATVDTRASRTSYRQALWVHSLTPRKHTVVVVVAGTAGRPAIVSDGLAYLG